MQPSCRVQPLDVAGRNQVEIRCTRDGFLLAGDNLRRAVAMMAGKFLMAEHLHNLAVVGIASKGAFNGGYIGAEAICRDLHPLAHPACQVRDKGVCRGRAAISHLERRDQLRLRVYGAPRPNAANLVRIAHADVAVFLADVAPDFVKLQTVAAKVTHRAVHHGRAALSYTDSKAHDGIAVNARDALNGADAGTLSQSADDGDLLVGIEYVCHEINVIQEYSACQVFFVIHLYVVTTTAPAAVTIMSEQAKESGENVSDIQRLTARAHELTTSIALWNSAYMVLVALTVVLAAGVFIAQFVANKKSVLLAGVQDEIIKEKDAIAAADSKAKDAKIADALQAAGAANERAGEANERAATLEVEALKLRQQLVAQGPREALLRGETRQKLVDALKPFAGQRVDFRNSASIIQVNGKNVMDTPIGDDTLGLATALIGVAKDAGWESPSNPLPTFVVSQGIEILVVRDASERTLEAAIALGHALQNVPFEKVQGPKFADPNRIARSGTDPVIPAFGKDTIVVEILSHP